MTDETTTRDASIPAWLMKLSRADVDGLFSAPLPPTEDFWRMLGVRAKKALRSIDATTPDSLNRISEVDILRQKGCGRTTLNEIRRAARHFEIEIGSQL